MYGLMGLHQYEGYAVHNSLQLELTDNVWEQNSIPSQLFELDASAAFIGEHPGANLDRHRPAFTDRLSCFSKSPFPISFVHSQLLSLNSTHVCLLTSKGNRHHNKTSVTD